jgi:multidrug resistance efflux pump
VETAASAGPGAEQLARRRDLWAQQLTTRESLDKAENDVKAAESGCAA